MIGAGKYDFPGIRKAGATAIKSLLSSYQWGAWILQTPFKAAIDFVLEWVTEWLANKGLILFNVGAFYVAGKFDQDAFDDAMDDGLKKARVEGISDKQKKAIDDAVINAFRKFGTVTRFNSQSDGVSNLSDVGLRTEDQASSDRRLFRSSRDVR